MSSELCILCVFSSSLLPNSGQSLLVIDHFVHFLHNWNDRWSGADRTSALGSCERASVPRASRGGDLEVTSARIAALRPGVPGRQHRGTTPVTRQADRRRDRYSQSGFPRLFNSKRAAGRMVVLHRRAWGAIVFRMWFLSAVLLLLQFQPLLGSALCLRERMPAAAECSMRQTSAPAERAVTQAGASHIFGCLASQYCAWTAPAVPRFAQHFQITPLIHRAPASMGTPLAPGDALAPPFHPPRA